MPFIETPRISRRFQEAGPKLAHAAVPGGDYRLGSYYL